MKKQILSFLCFTQFMISANNGNQWADFLCSKTAEEQQEEIQEKCIKTTYQERNKLLSNNNLEESKEKKESNFIEGIFIGVAIHSALVWAAMTIVYYINSTYGPDKKT